MSWVRELPAGCEQLPAAGDLVEEAEHALYPLARWRRVGIAEGRDLAGRGDLGGVLRGSADVRDRGLALLGIDGGIRDLPLLLLALGLRPLLGHEGAPRRPSRAL